MTVYFMPGFPTPAPLPDGWIHDGGDSDLCCVLCRRERAVAVALREAGLDPFDRAATKIRHRALIAFELERNPDMTTVALAKAAGVSTVTAGTLRRELAAETAGSST